MNWFLALLVASPAVKGTDSEDFLLRTWNSSSVAPIVTKALSFMLVHENNLWWDTARRGGEGGGRGSVADPWHFGVDPDPDPRIRASD